MASIIGAVIGYRLGFAFRACLDATGCNAVGCQDFNNRLCASETEGHIARFFAHIVGMAGYDESGVRICVFRTTLSGRHPLWDRVAFFPSIEREQENDVFIRLDNSTVFFFEHHFRPGEGSGLFRVAVFNKTVVCSKEAASRTRLAGNSGASMSRIEAARARASFRHRLHRFGNSQ